MPVNAGFTLKLNPAAKQQVNAALAEATLEVFVEDIWPDAVRGSPVAKGKTHGGKYAGGGTNRRSVTVEITDDGRSLEAKNEEGVTMGGVAPLIPGQVTAAIFTQSGYGGYLEFGTRKMAARPYIFPAFEKFKNKIAEVLGRNINMTKFDPRAK